MSKYIKKIICRALPGTTCITLNTILYNSFLQVSGELEDKNVPHTAKFIFDADQGQIVVFFDEERQPNADVPLPRSRNGQSSMFDGKLFIGGHENYNNLPWDIWSEAGFVGCVGYLRVSVGG